MRKRISMEMILIALVVFAVSAGAQQELEEYGAHEPQQIHLAFGEQTNTIVVTWSTRDDTKNSVVQYGIDGKNKFTEHATGVSKKFVDFGEEKRTQFFHRVTLPNLEYNTKYIYRCGSGEKNEWSDEFWVKIPPKNEDWQPYIAFYGDFGYYNGKSLGNLIGDAKAAKYDAIFHIGDFAYDFEDDNGKRGDLFMQSIQPIAAYLPYMTCPGNHEQGGNFHHYKARFNMPGNFESQTYSIDIGPMHVVFISTEFYYHKNGTALVSEQYKWAEEDLKKANLPENRAKQPWIIVAGHRPMYCSTTDGDDCTWNSARTRVGYQKLKMKGLEKLFYDQGVDIFLWAHEHIYERLWPVYDTKVYNGSVEAPYTNPKAPVHIISGSAGCQERIDHFVKDPHKWSAFRSRDYGYSRLKAYNRTHIYFDQFSVDKQKPIDSFWVIKDEHGPYKPSYRYINDEYYI